MKNKHTNVRETKNKNEMRPHRLAVTAGSLVGLTFATSAVEAVVVVMTGMPVSLSTSAPLGTSVTWDIDGVGTGEFRLRAGGSALYIASNTALGGQGNGRGMVAPSATDDVLALPSGFIVGPGALFGRGGSAQNGLYNYRNVMALNGAIGYDFGGFVAGDNFLGFAFDDGIGGGLNYGYAVINFNTVGGTVTISQWAYETSDNTPIAVGAIPEPSSLALLAIGAAGLTVYRKRRKTIQSVAEGSPTPLV